MTPLCTCCKGLEKLSEEYGVELKIIETLDSQNMKIKLGNGQDGANPMHHVGDLSRSAGR